MVVQQQLGNGVCGRRLGRVGGGCGRASFGQCQSEAATAFERWISIRHLSSHGCHTRLLGTLQGHGCPNDFHLLSGVNQTYAVLSRALDSSVLREDPPSLGAVLVAGTGTGLLQSFLISPVELLKIRLQLQDKACSNNKNPDTRKGPMSLAKSILKTEGVRGIFRGLFITALRDSPSYGVYFWSYEYTKELLHPGCRKTGEERLQTMLAAGGVAGVSSWICCYPLDVLKTRLQAQLPCSETTKYAGIVDCYNKSISGEGYGVLWRGLGTTVSRAFVVNGAVFAAYEFGMRALFQNQVK